MPKKIYYIVGIIGIIILAFILSNTYQTNAIEFEIIMVDYGYNKDGFGPTLTVDAGQNVRIKLINIGEHEHELVLVRDKNESLLQINTIINNLDLINVSEEEKIIEYEEKIEEIENSIIAFGIHQHEIRPGEEATLEFILKEPGVYWYTCLLVDGTWPESHQHKGMVGQIIVK